MHCTAVYRLVLEGTFWPGMEPELTATLVHGLFRSEGRDSSSLKLTALGQPLGF